MILLYFCIIQEVCDDISVLIPVRLAAMKLAVEEHMGARVVVEEVI